MVLSNFVLAVREHYVTNIPAPVSPNSRILPAISRPNFEAWKFQV